MKGFYLKPKGVGMFVTPLLPKKRTLSIPKGYGEGPRQNLSQAREGTSSILTPHKSCNLKPPICRSRNSAELEFGL